LRASDRALKELLSAEAMAELMAKRELEDDLSRQRLLELVGSWSAMPRAQVLAAATSLSARVAQMWQAGDLLVVFMERGRYVFARFTGKRIGNQLVVHASPAELDSVSVDLQQCFPIAEGIRSQLASGRSALSLTVTPINDFVQECTAALPPASTSCSREGAVVELAHRTMRDEAVDMSDYYALRHNMAVLGGSHASTVVRAWFAAQRAHLIERSIAFCKQLDVAQLPAPTRIRQLRDFARYPLDQLDSTQSLIGRFERAHGDALMQLVKRRDALLRGDVKNQLTSWWLGVIRERVSAFLAQVGYSRRARPQLPRPGAPARRHGRRAREQEAARRVSRSRHRQARLQAVLKELSEKIYPAIERFIKEACCTLALLAGLPAPVWPESVPSTDAAIEAGLNMSIRGGVGRLLAVRPQQQRCLRRLDARRGAGAGARCAVSGDDEGDRAQRPTATATSRRFAVSQLGAWCAPGRTLRTAIEVHDPGRQRRRPRAQSDAARDALYASAARAVSISASDSAAKLVTSSSGRKTQSAGNRFFGSMKGSLKSMLGMRAATTTCRRRSRPPPSRTRRRPPPQQSQRRRQ
jgi:hypothetical protein